MEAREFLDSRAQAFMLRCVVRLNLFALIYLSPALALYRFVYQSKIYDVSPFVIFG